MATPAGTETSTYVQELAGVALDKSQLYEERRSHCKVAALLLQAIPKTAIEGGDNVRICFMVTQVLNAGFSCANYNIDKPPAPGTKRDPADYMYQAHAESGGVLMKTYQHITKGNKGPASNTGALVSPGMIMQSMVFKDQMAEVFGPVDEDKERPLADSLEKALPHVVDLPAFSRVMLVLASRSEGSKATQNGNLVQIKRVKPCFAPYVFGSTSLERSAGRSLCSRTLDDSLSRRVSFTDSDALAAATGLPVDQQYILGLLSQTRHMLHVPGPELRGDIGRNADGTLYVSLRDGLEAFGVDVARVRLLDPHGFLGSLGDGDWVENLLRFAAARGALSVYFAVDSMRPVKGPADEQFMDGFCTIDVRAMLSACTPERVISEEDVPEEFRDSFFPEGTTAEDFDVFTDAVEAGGAAEDAEYIVVSKKMCSRRADLVGTDTAGAVPWWPVLCHPKQASLWREGRMVRVFRQGQLALFFVLSSHAMPAGAMTNKRRFNELDDADIGGYL